MIERLTENDMALRGYNINCAKTCRGGDCGACPKFGKLIDRLGAYEDTGLTPNEIEALKRDWSDLCTIVGECGGLDRIRELVKAD